MIGAKSGDAAVVLGADGPLAAAIGLVTGLNGRTVVVDSVKGAAARVAAAAADAGALLEFVDAPPAAAMLERGAFDLAVVRAGLAARPAHERAAIVAEAVALTRDNGRVLVVEGTARAGLFGKAGAALDAAQIETLLTAARTRAIRQLAAADGVIYFEARK